MTSCAGGCRSAPADQRNRRYLERGGGAGFDVVPGRAQAYGRPTEAQVRLPAARYSTNGVEHHLMQVSAVKQPSPLSATGPRPPAR